MATPSILQFLAASGQSPSRTFGSKLTPGSYVLFGLAGAGGAAVSNITSSAGNTYTLIASDGSSFVLYGGFNTAGNVNETVGWSTVGNVGAFPTLSEWSGVNRTTPTSGTPSVNQYASSPVTMNSITTTLIDCTLVIISGYCNTNAGWTFTGSYSGFTKAINSAATQLGYGAETTPGTYAPTWTMTNVNNVLFLVALVGADATAATPTFSPVAGTYNSPQTVTITSATSGGTIYYTTDGTTPTIASSSIPNGGTVSINSSSTLNAIEVAAGYNNSAVGSAAYTINSSGGGSKTWNCVNLSQSLRGLRK